MSLFSSFFPFYCLFLLMKIMHAVGSVETGGCRKNPLGQIPTRGPLIPLDPDENKRKWPVNRGCGFIACYRNRLPLWCAWSWWALLSTCELYVSLLFLSLIMSEDLIDGRTYSLSCTMFCTTFYASPTKTLISSAWDAKRQ